MRSRMPSETFRRPILSRPSVTMAHLRRRPGVAGSWWPDRLGRTTGRATGTRPDYPRAVSTAFEGFASTRLGQFFDPAAGNHPGLSGFSLLSHGREAFIVRLA